MGKQPEQNIDKYNDIFPTTLRGLLESHPKDGHKTTYKDLGVAAGVRQQTISQYAAGVTQPTADVVLKIARFFDVSVDYLLTGVSSANKGYHEELGLSEDAIKYLRKARELTLMENPDAEGTIPFLDELLSDKEFYQFMDDLHFHVENLRNVQRNREAVQKKYDGLNVEGYFNWGLQTEVKDFIYNELVKLGLQIKAE